MMVWAVSRHEYRCQLGCILLKIAARSLLTGAGSRGVLRNIASGRFSFPARLDLSAEIKDLIAQMLIVDPARRIPIAQIPAHPWLAPGMASATAVMEDAPVDYDLDA